MKWKRLTVSLLIVFLFMSACGTTGSTDVGKKDKSSTTGDSSSTTTSQEPVQLEWFSNISFWNPPATWNTDPNTVQGVITEKTGLTFEMKIPPQDADTKLSLLLVSGDLPDVITITNDTLIKKLVDSGKLWRMDELLQQYDPDSHLLKAFPEDIKQALILRDGGWYAYPSHMDSLDARSMYPPSDEYYEDGYKYRNNGAIMFNASLMEKAGITLDDVQTEDGLLAAFQKIVDMNLTVDGAAVIPLLVDGKTYQDSTLGVLKDMFGCMPVDKDGNYRDPMLSPEYKHALQFLNKSVRKGLLDPNQFTLDTTAVKATVMSERVFSFLGNTANTGFSDMEDVEWVSPGPILSNTGAKPAFGKSFKAGTGWMQTFVTKDTKVPDRVAKWLSFMSSDEGMRLHYYGFEGVDYHLNEKGLVVQTEQGRVNQTNQSTTGIFAYWPFHHIAWHDHATQAPTDIKTGADGIIAMQVQCAFGKSEHTFTYDNTPLNLPANYIDPASDLGNIQLQIDQYVEVQITKVVMAKSDEEFEQLYSEMIAKLKELGIDKIDSKINEQVQKQYKEYNIYLKGVNS
jgi:putative aldouronate transport system substrate-binding protein